MLMGESASIDVEPPLFNDSHLDLGLKQSMLEKVVGLDLIKCSLLPTLYQFLFFQQFNPYIHLASLLQP